MRKELILEDAGPQLDEWREAYVEKLMTELPKAVVLPMEHTISLSRRGQRVWIALNKRNSDDVRVVTWRRSTLVPLAVVFFVIAAIYLVAFVASSISYWSSYSRCMYSPYSYCYYASPYYYILPYIPVIAIFFGLAAALMKINKTREMQSLALQLARETWTSFSRRVEAKTFSHSVSQPAPPKVSVPDQTDRSEQAFGKYCMYCGTRVEKAGAKFCESCGKSLIL